MTLRRFLRGLRWQDWALTVVSIALIVVQVWMDLNLPAYMSRITVVLQTPGTGMEDLLRAGGVMLLFALGSLAASCAAAVCIAALSFSIGGELRSQVFRKVMDFSMAESDEFSAGSLITRSTNDVTQVQSFIVMGLQVIVKAPLTAVGAIGMVSGTVWQWTAVTAIGSALIVGIVVACVAAILPRQRRAQRLTDWINQIADANLTGISVIHAFNAEKTAEEKFREANAQMTGNDLFVTRGMALLSPAVQLVMNGMTLAIYWIGAVIIGQSGTAAQVGLFASMLAFAQYAVQIVNAFVTLTMVFTMLPRAMVSFRRIFEVIGTEPSVADDGTLEAGPQRGMLEFRHVDFCYPGEDEPTVRDVSFRAGRGQTVAIVGPTGSGKSTVVNLIPRLYDASAGEVLVDGADVRDFDLHSLREKVGYCPQQSTLLSGTVRSNVCYGGSAGDAEAADAGACKALASAQADGFVEAMDGGIDAPVTQGGTNLSGGQRQRLSIARALQKAPEVLVLDDSASALDYQTERELKGDLARNYPDVTKVIVTQRIGAVRDADLILVMDQGRVVGQGTHEELLKSCEVYRQIAETQEQVVSA